VTADGSPWSTPDYCCQGLFNGSVTWQSRSAPCCTGAIITHQEQTASRNRRRQATWLSDLITQPCPDDAASMGLGAVARAYLHDEVQSFSHWLTGRALPLPDELNRRGERASSATVAAWCEQVERAASHSMQAPLPGAGEWRMP
jgi:hypothetical protein